MVPVELPAPLVVMEELVGIMVEVVAEAVVEQVPVEPVERERRDMQEFLRFASYKIRISGLALSCLMLALVTQSQPFILPTLPVPHASVAPTYSVTLRWDANGPPVVGYLVYAGATTNSLALITNVTNVTATVTNFTLPKYFAVTGINTNGESKLSNIIGLVAQDLRIEVIGEHSDNVFGYWLEYPTYVFIGTNVAGHEFTRLKVKTTPIFRVVNLP